ncbi:hypothetical protein Tco_0792434 [Tanacetum coccineum]
MPTEMELTLEQTQQGVSYEVSVDPHGFEGASIRRHTGSYYPKRYQELLPKEILGATTQRDTGSYYPKRYWDVLWENGVLTDNGLLLEDHHSGKAVLTSHLGDDHILFAALAMKYSNGLYPCNWEQTFFQINYLPTDDIPLQTN